MRATAHATHANNDNSNGIRSGALMVAAATVTAGKAARSVAAACWDARVSVFSSFHVCRGVVGGSTKKINDNRFVGCFCSFLFYVFCLFVTTKKYGNGSS
jgi:hypothetical protein